MKIVQLSKRKTLTVLVTFVLTLLGCGGPTTVEDPTATSPSADSPAESPSAATPLTPVLEDETVDQERETEASSPPEATAGDGSVHDPIPDEDTPAPPPSAEPSPTIPPEPELPRNFTVALTFDDGPSLWSDDILEVLLAESVPATFFALGSEVNRYPEIATLLVNSGMDVQSHTYSHQRLTDLSDSQVRDQIYSTATAFVNAGLPAPTCARPPYGDHDSRTDSVFSEFGETVVTWNVDPRDWSKPGSVAIADSVYEQVTEISKKNKPSIVLLHDGGGDRSQTLGALSTIITKLKSERYEFFLVCERH